MSLPKVSVGDAGVAAAGGGCDCATIAPPPERTSNATVARDQKVIPLAFERTNPRSVIRLA
jgi:hypothetical protein